MPRPLIIHRDGKIYLFEHLDSGGIGAEAILPFSDLEKSPETVKTFEISPLSTWAAAAKGYKASQIIEVLQRYGQNKLPTEVVEVIQKYTREFGTLKLRRKDGVLELEAEEKSVIDEISELDVLKDNVKEKKTKVLFFDDNYYLQLKTGLYNAGYFVIDYISCTGETLQFAFRPCTPSGVQYTPREYQLQAAEAFLKNNESVGGGGTVVMPPYSGKTLVALLIAQKIGKTTLVLVENNHSAKRWRDEILEKTDLAVECISSFDETQDCRPFTICTYATAVKNIDVLGRENWGLIIYDDAHRFPAETYLDTAAFRSEKRVAITSTLARADRKGYLVPLLIGPKWFELLPGTLEKQGWLPSISCSEIRVPLPDAEEVDYNNSDKPHIKREIAAFNSNKSVALERLWQPTLTKKVLLTSYYSQLAVDYASLYRIQVVTTGISDKKEQEIGKQFNDDITYSFVGTKKIEKLDVNGIDILIALSYHQGSEREEYLRLGKLMEYSEKKKRYYCCLVTEDTIEEEEYRSRRRSLINYGYRFSVFNLSDLCEGVNIYEL